MAHNLTHLTFTRQGRSIESESETASARIGRGTHGSLRIEWRDKKERKHVLLIPDLETLRSLRDEIDHVIQTKSL